MLFFYAQGSKSAGLGHLARTVRLSSLFLSSNIPHCLVLDLDDYAESWILNRGVNFLNIDDVQWGKSDSVIIDAIHVDKKLEILLSRCNQRIIISPIFNAFNIATHILVREIAEDVRFAITDSVEITVDESFSFITSSMGVRKELDFTSLEIGICLSGGSQEFPYDLLFYYLETVPSLANVFLVGDNEEIATNIPIKTIPCQKTSEDLWEKLKLINFFIGRQGLMVAEALAQSIPVISLRETNEKQKNVALIGRGVVKSYEISTQGLEEMSEFLSQKSNIQKQHREVKKYLGKKDSSSLFRALTEIIK